jgi:hypothetical protein
MTLGFKMKKIAVKKTSNKQPAKIAKGHTSVKAHNAAKVSKTHVHNKSASNKSAARKYGVK